MSLLIVRNVKQENALVEDVHATNLCVKRARLTDALHGNSAPNTTNAWIVWSAVYCCTIRSHYAVDGQIGLEGSDFFGQCAALTLSGLRAKSTTEREIYCSKHLLYTVACVTLAEFQ